MYELTLEGRADGIFEDEGINWIDEIKGMYRKVQFFEEGLVDAVGAGVYEIYSKADDKE